MDRWSFDGGLWVTSKIYTASETTQINEMSLLESSQIHMVLGRHKSSWFWIIVRVQDTLDNVEIITFYVFCLTVIQATDCLGVFFTDFHHRRLFPFFLQSNSSCVLDKCTPHHQNLCVYTMLHCEVIQITPTRIWGHWEWGLVFWSGAFNHSDCFIQSKPCCWVPAGQHRYCNERKTLCI